MWGLLREKMFSFSLISSYFSNSRREEKKADGIQMQKKEESRKSKKWGGTRTAVG